MGADPPRERRPAVWPWLVMPLVVLAVFCALERMHHRPGTAWGGVWSKHAAGEESPPPTPRQ
ncbi:MAG TPA: hypothetical protein VEY89_09020 [Candidatus Dormibacteraeota bacterium]|nr:hypothetical protein [Candidatus Dormibacteraeota bacterium]